MTHVATHAASLRRCVIDAIDRLIVIADGHDGLFPSLIDPQTDRMFRDVPPAIAGQREGDRSRWGCNLMHDHPLLEAMAVLAIVEAKPTYAQAVDRYLRRFTSHCIASPSGLFPWGEHAYWRLDTDTIGNSITESGGKSDYPIIHDHLRAASTWLWQQLHAINPQAVHRFAKGLDYHFKSGEPLEYSRHACLLAGDPSLVDHPGYERSGRPRRLLGAKDGANDFPRHLGFYIHDVAFAWAHTNAVTGTTDDLEPQLRTLVNYWHNRFDGQNCLPLQSRGPDAIRSGLQTMSLAWSLLESARILEASPRASSDLIAIMRQQAMRYIDVCLTPGSSDDLDLLLNPQTPVWGGVYGHLKPVVCRYPHLYTGLYRMAGDDRLLTCASAMTHRIAATPIPTQTGPIPAMDIATSLQAMIDLAELSSNARWLVHALSVSMQAASLCFHAGLPTGATGITWYESQLGTSQLLHALSRVYCYARGWTAFTTDMSCR